MDYKGWGDILKNIILTFATVFTPVIMAYIGLFCRKHHLTLMEGIIEHEAQKYLLAESNKVALAAQTSGNRIQWGGVVLNAIRSLMQEHPNMTQGVAETVAHKMMLLTPGIGPLDLPTKENIYGRTDDRLEPEPGFGGDRPDAGAAPAAPASGLPGGQTGGGDQGITGPGPGGQFGDAAGAAGSGQDVSNSGG